ncbi:MAG: regulatory iron-sulfur-containing complex subunit RicT [Candidatus Pseudobacter hemicellulosilyticus]|uniref:Regulatory iron-sulfur-containing complex subunit RicT n=1 Tax=Candidatus Pseudobacter hemicellulosilyticus TaxID=3121375 RepID=A0AAJ6BH11_9BACT|nr:MAG: regulatory iron-sulfur-containing complex subunit RicT [Pseudobacter sp.]
MNVYDWLVNLPISDENSVCKVVEVSFNHGSRKDFFRNTTIHQFEKGDMISVEGISGFDVGEISMTGEMVRLQLKKKGLNEYDADLKKVLRRASDKDLEIMQQNKSREKDALILSRAIARQLNLNMKLSEVEIQADGRKATFFYIADDRVDFRELIKVYAREFKVKVEMRQIGARQEAAKVGGVGSCGRELCCSTWLTDFKSVNTTAARYQNLSINQSKLSGQCGRLKCCLNYELDTYLDALQHFPENADTIQVAKGTANLIKKDIFKNLMWYTLPDSNKQYPLTIERVRKIKQLNSQGTVPEELEPVDVTTQKPKEVEPEFVDVVGQISLRTLDKADKKRRHAQKDQKQQRPQGGGQQQGGGQRAQQGGQQQRPQQGGGQRGQQGSGQQGGSQQGGSQQGGGQQKGGQRTQQGGQQQQRPQQRSQQGQGGQQGGGQQGSGGQRAQQNGGQQGQQGGGQQKGGQQQQRPQQQRRDSRPQQPKANNEEKKTPPPQNNA